MTAIPSAETPKVEQDGQDPVRGDDHQLNENLRALACASSAAFERRRAGFGGGVTGRESKASETSRLRTGDAQLATYCACSGSVSPPCSMRSETASHAYGPGAVD